MERVGLIVISIVVASTLLVGASLGVEWLQPYVWHASQQRWFLPLVIGVGPGLYLIGQWLRRKNAPP